MKRLPFVLAALLLLACKDPFDFEPGDPTKPDPPGPPVLMFPVDGENTGNYAYPQDVRFEWRPLSRAEFYQIEVYSDSVLNVGTLVASDPRVNGTTVTLTFQWWGFYYWRVRAASRSWNNYTAWTAIRQFILPNPSD
ncbi:hypothetical protein FJY71_07425 [candidate division WOR-3 bacterium]|nr:hypothetical protein [candidate division WOR-3 bacterium]